MPRTKKIVVITRKDRESASRLITSIGATQIRMIEDLAVDKIELVELAARAVEELAGQIKRLFKAEPKPVEVWTNWTPGKSDPAVKVTPEEGG